MGAGRVSGNSTMRNRKQSDLSWVTLEDLRRRRPPRGMWRTREGKILALSAISGEHLRNIFRMLERQGWLSEGGVVEDILMEIASRWVRGGPQECP